MKLAGHHCHSKNLHMQREIRRYLAGCLLRGLEPNLVIARPDGNEHITTRAQARAWLQNRRNRKNGK